MHLARNRQSDGTVEREVLPVTHDVASSTVTSADAQSKTQSIEPSAKTQLSATHVKPQPTVTSSTAPIKSQPVEQPNPPESARIRQNPPELNAAQSAGLGTTASAGVRRKRKKRSIGSVIALIIGLILLAYPIVSDMYASFLASQSVTSYTSSVDNLSAEKKAEMLHQALSYNRALAGEREPGDADMSANDYYDILDVTGTGIMGSLEIPCIGVTQPIYHGTDDAVLMAGCGHMEGSSFPIASGTSHAAIAGHTGMPGQRMFDEVKDLVPGDLVKVKILDETYFYEVESSEVVEPDVVNVCPIESGRDLLTLVTCTPYGINDHRLLVRCSFVRYQEAGDTSDGRVELDKLSKYINMRTLPVVLFIVLLTLSTIFSLVRRAKRKKKAKAKIAAGRNQASAKQSSQNSTPSSQ